MEGELLEGDESREPSRWADGRDEMNLAEFPLAVLSDRVPAGQKTLTFEDRIFDHGRGEWLTRRLTIAASEKYGLPTASDDEVILGLIQVSREARFAERRVEFSLSQLIDVLGWRDEGKNYHRLDKSLKRWMGVTLYYDKAWWDKATESWVDESFHILDRVTIRRGAARREQDGQELRSSFTWNEVVFKSFKAGYLKQLDFDAYKELSLATSKRIYRFLDKRFWHKHKPIWEFELFDFACGKIGMSKNYDAAQLKRKLSPAIKELEEKKFLEPMPLAKRFLRVGRGDWRIVLQKYAGKQTKAAKENSVVEQLIERGVTTRTARELVRTRGEEPVSLHIANFDLLMAGNKKGTVKNPPGFLVKAIRENYKWESHGAATPAETVSSKEPQPLAGPIVDLKSEKESALISGYLDSLTDDEREKVKSQAIAEAKRSIREQYELNLASGNTVRAGEFLQAMITMHTKQLLQAKQRLDQAA